VSATAAAVTRSDRGTIFVTTDLWGYLAPFGCSENMRGGIARSAAVIEEAREQKQPVLFIDGGDSLFGQPQLTEIQVPQAERKAKALAESLRQMKLDVRATGELDDARGHAFRESLRLPTLADGEARRFDLGGNAVFVVAARDGATLTRAAHAARSQGARFVLGLLHVSMSEAQRIAEVAKPPVDLIVATHVEGELAAEENRLLRAAVPIVQPQSKGRSLLRLDVVFAGAPDAPFSLARGQADVDRELSIVDQRIALLDRQVNEPSLAPELLKLRRDKLAELVARREALASKPPPAIENENAFLARFITLEPSLPSDPKVAAILTAYDRDVGALNLAWAKAHGEDCPPPEKGKAAFVGTAECKECHAEAFPVWERSKHAHAFETLEAQSKQLHLDCVGCHVTGFQQPGGVCRLDKLEARKDVGCESCHGPGSLHVAEPSSDNIGLGNQKEVCVGCHNLENSPHFSFDTYLPKVFGKGHQPKKR
jgi:hypothetical protein